MKKLIQSPNGSTCQEGTFALPKPFFSRPRNVAIWEEDGLLPWTIAMLVIAMLGRSSPEMSLFMAGIISILVGSAKASSLAKPDNRIWIGRVIAFIGVLMLAGFHLITH